ncbi:hypothetical protein ACFL26_01540 [Patescibacteria group bacterium]
MTTKLRIEAISEKTVGLLEDTRLVVLADDDDELLPLIINSSTCDHIYPTKHDSAGSLVYAGWVDDMPVCVSLQRYWLNDIKVTLCDITSQCIDRDMATRWLAIHLSELFPDGQLPPICRPDEFLEHARRIGITPPETPVGVKDDLTVVFDR